VSRIIGIDLGTTNSCVAVMDGGEPLVIPNTEGARTTPSVVGFVDEPEPLVGQIAKRQAVTNPTKTLFAIKRMMGQKAAAPDVQRHAEAVAYPVVEASNGDAWVEVDGQQHAPAAISALVLRKMKQIAETYLGETVTDAIVTVPAYFDDNQRQATKDAGRIAGLNVLRILNEPTAAALAYGRATGAEARKVAVYDLGGGTFDISLLQLQEGVFQVKATGGDAFLGGEDLDARLVEFLCETFETQSGIDIRADRMARQRLREAAEKAKHELSADIQTEVNLPFIAADETGPKHLILTISRSQLESLTAEIVERSFPCVEGALKDAHWCKEDIDDVILVGGQTRMPLVQDRVQAFFGRAPSRAVNPDEVVAVGAALQAAVMAGEEEDVILLDVTPLSLGVETGGGVFTPLIGRNTTIPAHRTEIFTTAVDNQPYVNVHVLQGERQMAQDNRSLAHFQLSGIPPAPRGLPQIEVSFDIDSNGIVNVSAKNLDTGKEQKTTVRPSSGLSEEQIESLIREAQNNQDADKQKKMLANLSNAADALIYGTEMAIKEYGTQIDAGRRADVEQKIAACRGALNREDANEAQSAVKELESAAQSLFAQLH